MGYDVCDVWYMLFQVTEKGSMIVQELSHVVNVSAVLAKERYVGIVHTNIHYTARLLLTEQAGRVCRDESIQGLRFFPNKFLQF